MSDSSLSYNRRTVAPNADSDTDTEPTPRVADLPDADEREVRAQIRRSGLDGWNAMRPEPATTTEDGTAHYECPECAATLQRTEDGALECSAPRCGQWVLESRGRRE